MNSNTFSALAEPHRLEIVELLRQKPRAVGEIADTLHLRQPQVSKHLKVLADAGLVDVTPRANVRVYGLTPDRFKELDDWVRKYRKLWEERFDRLDTLLREEKLRTKNKKQGTKNK
jgi:DNA-binding transcriptional ArsR family regulator